MKKLLLTSLLGIGTLALAGCDNYPYKQDIQELYDWNNQTGDKAICMMVGEVTQSMYPYTIKYMDGADLPFTYETREAHFNQLTNESLHFFSGLGFFSEELVGEEQGKPLYRYELTDLGKQYVKWKFGATNFCFGRIIVDSIGRKRDSINGVGGGTIREVNITYHVENIPDWVKNSEAYERFRYPKEITTGEPLPGTHTYRVLGNNKLDTISGVSGNYQW
ncbi:hypothetical protein [Candidatus Schmidhempelia bombi]|uniref:Lipoprotein n=1 Tax=Candidatus Schmidhempelia bombi str. Bimp TaxID=1387197 RepID=A0AB94IEJ5_9GAMM|nr:hypothetical protein [Candidatus Schmidhempelia bombi]TEA27913.1 hypothetical protein O970_01415 [Candidatus Schmidhempelia bombi str. Bimp]